MGRALRVVRKIVDWLIISMMILLVILSVGFVGNANPSLPDSDLDFYLEFAGYILWILVPLAATRLSFETRRGAGCVCFVGMFIAIYFPPSIPFLWLWDGYPFLPRVMSVVFISLGLYWLLTSALGCPPVLPPSAQPSRSKRRALISGGIAVCALGLILMAIVAALPFELLGFEDCVPGPPSAAQVYPEQEVFIASDALGSAWKPTRGYSSWMILGWLGIARIKKHYWGLPWFSQHYLLLARPPEWQGETFFYDGHIPYGIFARFLPVATFHKCCRMNLISEAELDLKVLKDGPSPFKGRILGQVQIWSRVGQPPSVKGIKATIITPSGTFVTTTDEKGYYDAPSLPPGRFSIDFDVKSQGDVRCIPHTQLEAGQIIKCDAIFPHYPFPKHP